MRFIVDAQLPPALAKALRDRGYEAEHVNRIGLGPAPDTAIWRHVEKSRAVLLTKDSDFIAMARAKTASGVVVQLRTGNVAKRVLVDRFLADLPRILEAIEAGSRVIEFH